MSGLTALVPPDTETLTWADETSAASRSDAVFDLDRYIVDTGPFDGVMAFSSGAALATTLLLYKQQKNPVEQRLHPLFKCAIFFSRGIPGDLIDSKVKSFS